jgi:hypothetical protein
MKSLRLASGAWILAAIVAGAQGAFIVGLAEENTAGLLLIAGALLAVGTGIFGFKRPTTRFARWSVLLTIVWVLVSLATVPLTLMAGTDQIAFGAVPAVLPLVAGLASLPFASRRGPE